MSIVLRMSWNVVPLLLILVFNSAVVGKDNAADANAQAQLSNQQIRLTIEGSHLSAKQAGQLEDQLRQNPKSLNLHLKLLGYYFFQRRNFDLIWLDPLGWADRITFLNDFLSKRPHVSVAKSRRAELVLWIIEHHPDTPIAGKPETELDPTLDPSAYIRARETWLKQLQAHPENTSILSNAANFLELYDPAKSVELLEKAKTLEPRNPDFSEQLARVFDLQRRNAPATQRKALLSKALGEYETTMNLTSEKVDRFYLMGDLATAALKAGDEQKARQYALMLLKTAPQFTTDWNYGNAIFTGHSVLGQLALNAGDVQQADRELIKAGQTLGSPQLNSFGPDMTLAKALLKKGQKKVVLQYLQLISSFWGLGRQHLAGWTHTIETGGTPNFDQVWGP